MKLIFDHPFWARLAFAFALVLAASFANSQQSNYPVSTITAQNAGTTQGTVNGAVTVNFTSGCTSSVSGNTLSISCTGGGGSGTVSANNGAAGAVANYAAAGGSTTVGPDATLSDSGTTLSYTGTGGVSSGTFTSTVSTGTAPFTVASNTVVPNLNASSLAGKSFVNPGPIGSTTAASGSFTVLQFSTSLAPTSSGHITDSSTAPTIGTCGTSPSVVASNGTAAFELNVGTGGTATTCSFTLPTAATGWLCDAVDVSSPTTGGGYHVKQTSAISPTSVTLTGYNTSGTATAWNASDLLLVKCRAF